MNRCYRTVIFSVSALLLSLTMCVEIAAQPAQLERLWTGLVSTTPVSDIAVKDDAGYVVSERGLEIYDLRPSPTLRLHTVVPLIPRNDPRIRLADDTLLLVWNSDTGVSVYSVVDAIAPRFLNHVRLTGVYDVDAQGTRLYAAWRDPETPVVRQVDWTLTDDPPETTDIMWSMNGFERIAVGGNHVFGLGYGFDNHAIYYARIPENGPAQFVGFFERFYNPNYLFVRDMVVWDSLIVLLPIEDGFEFDVETRKLFFFRMSAESELTYRGATPLPWGYKVLSMEADDDVLLLNAKSDISPVRTLISARIIGDSSLAYTDTLETGLMRDDVAEDPHSPHGAMGSAAMKSRTNTLKGGQLFWRNQTGLYAGTIDENGRMTRTGDKTTGVYSYDVDGIGRDRVFTVTTDTLFGMDFSDPASPVFLSRTPWRAEGIATVDRNRLITFDSVVTLFDVSNPRLPQVLDTLNLGEGRIVWETEVHDSVIVLCCLNKGTVVLVLRGDRLFRACEIDAQSTDALWMNDGLLLTTLDTTTAVWETFTVIESQHDWCSPERLKVWGKKGQALTQVRDAVIVATGRALVVSDASSLPEMPTLLHAIGLGHEVAGIHIHDGLLFVEDRTSTFRLFRIDDTLGIKALGSWAPYLAGDSRLYLVDSIMLAAERMNGLQSFVYSLNLLDAPNMPPSLSTEAWLSIMPNVAAEQATVSFVLPSRTHVRLRLLDGGGRLVKTISDTEYPAGITRLCLLVDAISVGTYWVQLESKDRGAVVAPLQIVR